MSSGAIFDTRLTTTIGKYLMQVYMHTNWKDPWKHRMARLRYYDRGTESIMYRLKSLFMRTVTIKRAKKLRTVISFAGFKSVCLLKSNLLKNWLRHIDAVKSS